MADDVVVVAAALIAAIPGTAAVGVAYLAKRDAAKAAKVASDAARAGRRAARKAEAARVAASEAAAIAKRIEAARMQGRQEAESDRRERP